MSESTAAAGGPVADAAATAPKPAKPVMMIGVIALALAAGAGGGFVLAPRLLPAAARTAADSAAAAEVEDGDEKEGGAHGQEGKQGGGRIFRLDNLIVNPAGSEGSRFLMASVAFEVETDKAEAVLKERDVQVRDLVMAKLESLTMQMLTQPFARDSIKRQLGQVVGTVVGPKTHLTVYLPQFVIQ